MEIVAYQKSIRIPPRKARLVADAVRVMTPTKALLNLKLMQKAAAYDLHKVLRQAIANAVNNSKLDEKDLIIKHILIEEGPRYKKFRAGARGRARTILKRSSHIKIVLESKDRPIVENKKENK